MSVTDAWERMVGTGRPPSGRLTLRSANTVVQQGDADAGITPGFGCVVWDEEAESAAAHGRAAMADTMARVDVVNALGAVSSDAAGIGMADTDATARQGDGGPYHWAQGPQDVTTLPEPEPANGGAPSPPAAPVVPINTVPRSGRMVTTSDLNLREMPGRDGKRVGVMPAGSTVELTGGRRRVVRNGVRSLWVRVRFRFAPASDPVAGWCDSTFLAAPAAEWSADGAFPPITHEWRVYVEDTMDVPRSEFMRVTRAIFDDPRGPLRAGLRVVLLDSAEGANVVLRLTAEACGGAAGCYYKQAGQVARADVVRTYYGGPWYSRVLLHEVVGHAATRCYDHYKSAPQYPRPDYFGLMGDWQSKHGDHAWPDEDDVANWAEWLAGASRAVYFR